ncbi:MAG: FAD:protein FMN transferase [Candidatus Competibacter sp.]|nr:FAD:protein FMN transferase [Candidatus Competibacter sp.]MDG4582764.1 FAD:protein FMN transferase [Candidatus Competibacter sp.]
MPLLVGLVLAACDSAPPDPTVRLTGATMGTSYELKLAPAPGQTVPADLQARIEEMLIHVNRQMSTYDPDSELSRFNRNPSTDWVPVSSELQQVVAESLRIGELSGGAFDITVGPLVNLWGFGPDPRRDDVPSETAIAQARERVGHQRLHARADPPALKKDRADLYVDLSAVAKGYGVDRMAALIDGIPIENYLASIGGEIRARGHNGRGEPWTIAIEKPEAGQRSVERLIRPGDRAVSTSGDYRNFFEQNGQRYSHIINPRTGWPVPHTLASVTVIGDRSMVADATATALMAAGPESGFQLASEHHLAAFFVLIGSDGGFRERFTPEFGPYLLPQQP